MTVLARKRLMTRLRSPEPLPWSAAAAARVFLVSEVAAGAAALLCVAWWAASPELLVRSGWREGGRVLSCEYLSGTRVVEWQYADGTRGTGGHACPLLRSS